MQYTPACPQHYVSSYPTRFRATLQSIATVTHATAYHISRPSTEILDNTIAYFTLRHTYPLSLLLPQYFGGYLPSTTRHNSHFHNSPFHQLQPVTGQSNHLQTSTFADLHWTFRHLVHYFTFDWLTGLNWSRAAAADTRLPTCSLLLLLSEITSAVLGTLTSWQTTGTDKTTSLFLTPGLNHKSKQDFFDDEQSTAHSPNTNAEKRNAQDRS